jgi:large subunit ribosomal protein L7/L12
MSEEDKKVEEKTEEKTEETKPEAKAEEPKAEVKEEKAEEKTETPAEEEAFEVPAQFKDFIEKVESLSVLELHELVKVFEKKFGVSAQATVVAGGAGEAGVAEEKDSFNVELTAIGDQKIQVIKAVKEILGLGLKEAKDMVDGAPTMLKEGAKKEEADEMKAKIEAAGGQVELK